MTILNRITLEALARLPVTEIVALPPAELARLQNLIQSIESKLRQRELPTAEVERLQQQQIELIATRKECLDRTKPTSNSFSP